MLNATQVSSVNKMNKKIVIAGTLLALGAILLVAVPTLAHPLWDEETEEHYPWWDTNKTYPIPHWDANGTYTGPHWNGTESMPYWGEYGEYCPGPYWADPDAEPPYEPEDAPRRGYGCGGMKGYGGSAGSRRGPSRWTG